MFHVDFGDVKKRFAGNVELLISAEAKGVFL
jgi:hypothetical protein